MSQCGLFKETFNNLPLPVRYLKEISLFYGKDSGGIACSSGLPFYVVFTLPTVPLLLDQETAGRGAARGEQR